ncbi:Di-copper centre-containing protein [Armillaria borealis]|uniref:Di-copper centre-containing protein n=1 Tax=Armillaria borealis TaxID=47425 RepID=A0AA39K478_9AGAR|nr:Di-copper centre-containing protein [Armillaria borealis]
MFSAQIIAFTFFAILHLSFARPTPPGGDGDHDHWHGGNQNDNHGESHHGWQHGGSGNHNGGSHGGSPSSGTCKSPTTRVEWTTLTQDQKDAYFEAELCLLAAPAQLQARIDGVVSRYDDLVGSHVKQGNIMGGVDLWHVTGQFLAAHRYYVHTHEYLLRNECGYTGPIPYWNEQPDAGSFATSETVLDFGGEGIEEDDYAVVDGPFANLTRYLGPGTTNTAHLLTREGDPKNSLLGNQTYVDAVMAETSFAAFQKLLFNTLHAAGHGGVGGDMVNPISSPDDPIFFMHHGYLDYVWWKWQGRNDTRIHDLEGAGNETQAEPATGYVPTSEATNLYMYDILPNITVGDVLDTQGGYLCYIYA